MVSKWKSAIASVAVLVGFAVPTQANTVAHWALDEGSSNGEDLVGEVGVDQTGTYPGEYKGGLFGGNPVSATGITGVPSTAIDFNANGILEIPTPWDPNDPNDRGGIASRHDQFQIEYFINWQGNPKGVPYSENGVGNNGPNLHFEFSGTFTSPTDMEFQVSPWTPEAQPPVTPSLEPPGGFDAGQWYYISGQYTNPIWEDVLDGNGDPIVDENGDPTFESYNLIEAGVTELYIVVAPLSGSPVVHSLILPKGIDPAGIEPRTDYLKGNTQAIERVILSSHGAGGGATDAVIDEVKVFDQMFDPNSYLVSVLGIPEPSSLAVLALGGLLLTRRRRGA